MTATIERPSAKAGTLAVLGGSPSFARPLCVGRPNIGARAELYRRFDEMLDRKWLTNDGPFVKEFERRIAAYVGVEHCVATCNATVALEIAVRALGLRGEVIVPSYTFVATAHALQWQEITPIFCDIDLDTHNLDPRRVERMITSRTSGIIGVHLWGRAAQIEELDGIARRRGLALLFDSAHAFGCSHGGRMLGSFGRCEIFSFHATKFVNSFEGGAVVTNDGFLAEKVRCMRNFGFAGYDNVISVGTNGKMCEAAAAMGLNSLDSLDNFVAVNRRNYEAYAHALSGVDGLRLVPYDPAERNNYQYVVVEVDADQFGLTRDELVAVLHGENVLARRYFFPGCHRMEPYRSCYPDAGQLLPETERLAARIFTFPTGMSVSERDVHVIGDIVRRASAGAAEVRRVLIEKGDVMMAKPKVSVLVVTYNHERFIERAVRGALSQQADFEYEIIIGEDCSTDGTRAVLARLNAEFPGRLRLLLGERNFGPQRNFQGAYMECRGDYIALLDGDDYWTDPDKLRKQVAVLDADPSCTLCYHPTRYVSADEEPTGYIHPPETTPVQPTINDLFRSNLINPCSAMLRRAAVPELPDWMLSVAPGDWPLFLLAADAGRLLRMDEVMAAYRIHAGGTWSQLSVAARLERTFDMLAAVDRHFHGKYADQVETNRIGTIRWLCDQIDHARQQTGAAQQELASIQQELAQVRQELAITRDELAKVIRARTLRLARAMTAVPRRAVAWLLRPS
jgi:dTDP-4-amino-4,6-dideoxygalactose transaminase/glycosyltransferase involved in cell wall biosynthesis